MFAFRPTQEAMITVVLY